MEINHTYFFALLLLLLIAERLDELRSANRNTRRLIELGGLEYGANHYRAIVAMHIAFFISLTVEFALRDAPIASFWPVPFAVFLVAQLLRFFTRRAMGERWTTRIVVIHGEQLITTGPFRFLRHPIYLAVALEVFSIPFIFALYVTCVIFSILNASMLLFVRIPAEKAALSNASLADDAKF